MNYYSTNNLKHKVSLQKAVLEGLAQDNGLYMPESIPVLSLDFFQSLSRKSFKEISFEVAHALIGNDLPQEQLQQIIDQTISFDAPLVKIEEGIYALELFHGPTLAFKDFGAKFLAGLLGYYAKQQSKEMTVLVATSGDTGSAVANGFYHVEGTKVVVLYPSGKVSDLQEKQFTTLGGNITSLEINGTFDDCQRLVKQAFLDKELQQRRMLTSANSINIARLIPQSFYYFWAYSQLADKPKELVISVPSGNFGNLTAGLFAKRMGLPITQFIASTNINDVVPAYLNSGVFEPRASSTTISNAMDVGNPSNFARIVDLYKDKIQILSQDIVGCRMTDEETVEAIQHVYVELKYMLDPHGAVGYLGLKKSINTNKQVGIFLETAHPGKFREVVEKHLHQPVILPERLQAFLSKEKKSTRMENSFDQLKNYLLG
jgi:threonine synthase